MKKYLLIIALLCASFMAFGARYKELELFSHVLNFVERSYFEPVKMKKLVHGAIKGMLRELDSHSHFFTPDEFAAFKNHVQDKAFILGMEVDKKEGDFVVLSTVRNSPAQKAGFLPGDKIIGLNGRKTETLTLVDLYKKLQTKFQKEFLVLRPPASIPIKIKVNPGMVKLQSVQHKKLENKYLYLRIYQFSFSSFFQVNKILQEFFPKEGLLIDLRGNPGGVLEQAVKIADLFLMEGAIVYYKERGKKQVVFPSHRAPTLKDFPLLILIDEYSASGSEILAGALKDHSRALIVGRNSFGKGSVQSFFRIGKDYALKLTVGEYRTPAGYSINKKGIVPHIVFPKRKQPPQFQKTSDDLLQDKELKKAFHLLKNFQEHKKTYLSKSTAAAPQANLLKR